MCMSLILRGLAHYGMHTRTARVWQHVHECVCIHYVIYWSLGNVSGCMPRVNHALSSTVYGLDNYTLSWSNLPTGLGVYAAQCRAYQHCRMLIPACLQGLFWGRCCCLMHGLQQMGSWVDRCCLSPWPLTGCPRLIASRHMKNMYGSRLLM